MSELKLCPFCGEVAEIDEFEGPTGNIVFGVMCTSCVLYSPHAATKRQAKEYWNTRTADLKTWAVIDAARKMFNQYDLLGMRNRYDDTALAPLRKALSALEENNA